MRIALSAILLAASATAAFAVQPVTYAAVSREDSDISRLVAGDSDRLLSGTLASRPELQVARVGGSVIVQGSNANACGVMNCWTVIYRNGRKIAEKLACDGSAGDHKLYMQGRWLFACGWLVDLATGQRPKASTHPSSDLWSTIDHNGSEMILDGREGVISYLKPKASIAGVVKPGDVLLVYENRQLADIYSSTMVGTAWVYKKGCAPASYPVSEVRGGSGAYNLRGQAPLWNGCEVVGYRSSGPNNELRFGSNEPPQD